MIGAYIDFTVIVSPFALPLRSALGIVVSGARKGAVEA